MAPIYLGKMVVPSSLRYIENLANPVFWPNLKKIALKQGLEGTQKKKLKKIK